MRKNQALYITQELCNVIVVVSFSGGTTASERHLVSSKSVTILTDIFSQLRITFCKTAILPMLKYAAETRPDGKTNSGNDQNDKSEHVAQKTQERQGDIQ